MAETSIEWTATRLPDGTSLPGYTFNPWWGCVKVSPACTNCYAATWANRYGVEWGPKAERRFFGEARWHEPAKWNRKAARDGIRRKVFCASMADVFERLPEEHPQQRQMDEARKDLWLLIEATPHLDWLLLTKRPEHILEMVPPAWRAGFPAHVRVGTTVENPEQARQRLHHLAEVPAQVRFVSCEPLLAPLTLQGWDGTTQWNWLDREAARAVHWVIAGGESGPEARPSHPDWFRSLRDQCVSAGVPFFFKQWGAWEPFYDRDRDDPDWRKVPEEKPGVCRLNLVGGQGFHGDRVVYFRNAGKKHAGRLLDGREWNEMPAM